MKNQNEFNNNSSYKYEHDEDDYPTIDKKDRDSKRTFSQK